MTEKTAPHHRTRKRRSAFNLSALAAERRRLTISFAAGLFVLLLIQIPAVEQSFLGAPDREMMVEAFKLRGDLIRGTAEPVLFLDIDDRTLAKLSPSPFASPLNTTPRGLIADMLDFIRAAPANRTPRVVVMDIDIAQPPSDGPAGVAKLQAALANWATSPTAPALIVARQSYPSSVFGMSTPSLVLPTTDYDDIVQRSPNIFWATPKVLGDQNGLIWEFTPFECVLTPTGIEPLYSAALIAYQFAERDPKVLADAPAKHWMEDGAKHCQNQPSVPLLHGERIDYHMSLDLGFNGRVWPPLDPAWPGFKTCGDTDTAIFRRLSVIDILDALHAGADISHDLLCQRVVIMGGTNASAVDFVQTPLNEMNGSVVLANAIRGLELTHGGLRPIPLPFQIMLVGIVSLSISAVAITTERARHRQRALRQSEHKHKLGHRLAIISLNPIVLNGIIALLAHYAGVALLLISLNYGLWGFLSAPAFAAAITETIQEFLDG